MNGKFNQLLAWLELAMRDSDEAKPINRWDIARFILIWGLLAIHFLTDC